MSPFVVSDAFTPFDASIQRMRYGEVVQQADETVERLRLAFELFAAGEEMLRQNLKRRFPDASEEEVEAHIQEWLRDRPGAELGDSAGEPQTWPREAK